MTSRRLVRFLASAAVAAVVAAPSLAAAKTTIKFATLVPDGAPGTDVLHAVKEKLEEKSGGEIKVKLFLGVDGDEKDIVRKMRIGQRNAAQMTGVGLAEIVPEVHVLDLPFFFEEYGEVDYVYERILEHFEKAFDEKGYVFLGFTETGFVYLYSQKTGSSLEDLRKSKIWAWEGDPLSAAFVEHAKLQAVPLAPPDVLTSLQTGLIDTVYAPPVGMLALQWHTKVDYMMPVPFVHATGGVVMSKKIFGKLSAEHQELVLTEFRKTSKALTKKLRTLNEESAVEITKSGVEDLPPPSDEALAEIKTISAEVAEAVKGEIYPAELLEQVRTLRDEYRAQQADAPAPAE